MISKPNILIVDDDLELLESFNDVLEQNGCRVLKAESAEIAIEILGKSEDIDMAILDYKLPGMNGLALLKKLKEMSPDISVIMLTGYGTVENAVEAVKLGANDYLQKPFKPEELVLLIEKTIEYRKLQGKTRYLLDELSSKFKIENIVGQSKAMKEVFEKIRDVAESDSSVMIVGESGTGKELIARHIHYASLRKDQRLVSVSCAALAPGLIESELFGHEDGSFTGSKYSKTGRLMSADNGTLFLDEVGEIPLLYQKKLLRVLDSQTFEKVGSDKSIKSNFRLISATNHDLLKDIGDNTFRADLYYRLNVVEIRTPPLVERKEDIPLLLDHFLKLFTKKMNKKIKGFSSRALATLQKHDWPGNVRELKNLVERATVFCKDDMIDSQLLPLHIQGQADFNFSRLSTRSIQEVEKGLIAHVLWENDYNQKKSAEVLGISRSTLHSKIVRYQLEEYL